MKRKSTDYIVIHCAATPPSMDIGVDEIRTWHVDENGWSDVGYHFVVRRGGKIELGRELLAVGAHVRGYNSQSVGICMVGGTDDTGEPEANFTTAQYNATDSLVSVLKRIWPNAKVVGHRDLDHRKDCPSFDAQARYEDFGI